MQELYAQKNNRWVTKQIPAEDDRFGSFKVKWGKAGVPFSPAFWRWKYWSEVELKDIDPSSYRLGENLLEEIVGCLLGGYGIKAEVAMEYLRMFKEKGVINNDNLSQQVVWALLQDPVVINGRDVRYRFWKSKGTYLFQVLTCYKSYIEEVERCELGGRELRTKLMAIPGIGIKTSSWIARNWTTSNDVAVIDIHIQRALRKLGSEVATLKSDSDYLALEKEFIAFSDTLNAELNYLDLLVWDYMRSINDLALPDKKNHLVS